VAGEKGALHGALTWAGSFLEVKAQSETHCVLVFVLVHFFLVWCDWDLNLGLHTCKGGTLLLELYTSSPFFSGYFGDKVSKAFCLG
jgi:hypothetical protein